MWLTDTAIRRPLTIVMLLLGICVLGYQSMKRQTETLDEQFAESARLEKIIRNTLKEIGYGKK